MNAAQKQQHYQKIITAQAADEKHRTIANRKKASSRQSSTTAQVAEAEEQSINKLSQDIWLHQCFQPNLQKQAAAAAKLNK